MTIVLIYKLLKEFDKRLRKIYILLFLYKFEASIIRLSSRRAIIIDP